MLRAAHGVRKCRDAQGMQRKRGDIRGEEGHGVVDRVADRGVVWIGGVYFGKSDEAMKLIQLSQGKFAMVDDEDYERVSQFKWHANKDLKTFYARRQIRDHGLKRQRHESMHRFILGFDPDKEIIDHVDGDGLNNQRYNLRFATKAENCRNARPAAGKYSKYKGVWFNKLEGKYMAGIMVNRKAISLGYFSNEVDAAMAYNNAAIIYHGEFAFVNKID